MNRSIHSNRSFASSPSRRRVTTTAKSSSAPFSSSEFSAPRVFTVDGLLFDDSRQLTTMAYKAALKLFPDQKDIGEFGAWPYFKRFREILPAVQDLSELPLLIRMLAEEGIVPVGQFRDPDSPLYKTRRTRALNTASIVDPENALYLIETVQMRWRVATPDLIEAFRSARAEVLSSTDAVSGPSSPIALPDGCEGLKQTHTFAVNAINSLQARGDRVVVLTADDPGVTAAQLKSIGVNCTDGVEIVSGETESRAFDEFVSTSGCSEVALFSDRLRFLQGCMGRAKGVRVTPVLCSWGYNTASLRASAEAGGRIRVVDSIEFVSLQGLEDSRAVMDGIDWR